MVKNPPANARDLGSIPGLERSPEEGNGNPLQYSCLENPVDRGAWKATVHDVAKDLNMTWRLSNNNSIRQMNHNWLIFHTRVDIWVVSSFELLQIKLLLIIKCKPL